MEKQAFLGLPTHSPPSHDVGLDVLRTIPATFQCTSKGLASTVQYLARTITDKAAGVRFGVVDHFIILRFPGASRQEAQRGHPTEIVSQLW